MNDRITINTRAYKINPMRADEKAALGLDLLPVLAGPVGQILRSKDIDVSGLMKIVESKGKIDEQLGGDELIKMVAAFIDIVPQLNMKVVWDLFSRSISSVNCIDGKLSDEPTRDVYFNQYPEDYYAVCIWSLWENTRGFLVGSIPGLKEIFRGSAAVPSESISPENGKSTGSSHQSIKPDSVHIPTLSRG